MPAAELHAAELRKLVGGGVRDPPAPARPPEPSPLAAGVARSRAAQRTRAAPPGGVRALRRYAGVEEPSKRIRDRVAVGVVDGCTRLVDELVAGAQHAP